MVRSLSHAISCQSLWHIIDASRVCCCCQRSDVSAAIKDTEIFDFLEDAVPDDKQVRWSAS